MIVDNQPTSSRVKFGKDCEDKVIQCLNKHYSHEGYELVSSSFLEDCKEKTDCWQITKSGKRLRSAIKTRTTKKDILVALRDPFYGINHPETVVGRDILNEYFQYITLYEDTIRVAKGSVIHKICDILWEEFLDEVGDIDVRKSPYNSGRPRILLESKMYMGCQIWLHFDRWKHCPKLLAFIPTDILKEGKEIKFHKLIEV